jgi:hypothetical protein
MTKMCAILKISAVGTTLVLSTFGVSALEGNFDSPRYKDGLRLDVCLGFGQNCGQAPADLYCRVHGYQRATRFETEHATPTRIAGDPERMCNANFCAAFKHIVCFTSQAQPDRQNNELWPHPID